jgi:solute carrier family 6 serotonin transporter-like protein 4
MYFVDLLNVYGPGIAILLLVFVEAMGVSWCYGTQRFSDDIESMLGFQPGPFCKITCAYVIFILVDYYKIHSMK